jgi:N-acetylmuramoyl-L-alanine amidase
MGKCLIFIRAVWMGCALFWACASFGVQQSSLPTKRIGGVEYLALWDVTRLYNPTAQWRVEGQTLHVLGANSMRVTVNSRDAEVNGLRVRLSAPIVSVNGRVMIARADALNGLLALWSASYEPRQVGRRGRAVIDPGHGGENTGTRGRTSGVYEKTLVLDIAFRVERLLREQGVEVVMTRRSDVFVELSERAAIANRARADAFVSIHLNWAADASVNGVETFYMPRVGEASAVRASARFDNGQRFAGNENDGANELLSQHVHRALLSATGAADRRVRGARFAVLRDARIPATLVECGYLSNAAEERRVLTEEYRERIARGIANGIVSYLNVSKR